MNIQNTQQNYGLVTRVLHWGMALAIFAMFALGLWMRTLDYYSPWYKTGPDIHKSMGIILLITLSVRVIWRLVNVRPDDSYLPTMERALSHLVHWAFYLLLLAQMVAGYLISTVDGRAISVFDWFAVPSLYEQKGLEDTVGDIHEWMAYGLMALVALHVAAALKHHFIDGDVTLKRMLFTSSPDPLQPDLSKEKQKGIL